jgi:hypothetical protein
VGVHGGPKVKSDGLVLALDGANYKSFKGEVTTNLIPNPTVNAYPTTGNAWGTYNTNQYGSGTYFSIGTVNNVTNNIITMTSAHSLRTYDVMNPQTTGGGVTAGTNYFIKKVSDTSFTLHAYNGSQDGSQGYISSSTGTHKVYDSIATDTRISVNSTSFPTMWWGAPHLPNSGLVKELRYGEFNAIPNLPANDCIRLHYIRTDDVKDGMSYGVDCAVTPNSPVTVSFYTRSANANAVGKVVQYYIYNYNGGNPTAYAWNFTLGPLGVWQRQTFTYTPVNQSMISYWFPQSTGTYAWDWSCMQVEQKSYATTFVAGTRGTTVATGGGWADLTGNGNHGELVNGVRESSDNLGALVFDGVDDYISIPSQLDAQSPLTGYGSFTGADTNAFTLEIWIKTSQISGSNSYTAPHLIGRDNGDIYSNLTLYNGYVYFVHYNSAWLDNLKSTTMVADNIWHQVVYVNNTNETGIIYIDGKSEASGSSSISGANYFSPDYIGRGYSNRYFQGSISICKFYDKSLTPQEIQQNFIATRSRFGI